MQNSELSAGKIMDLLNRVKSADQFDPSLNSDPSRTDASDSTGSNEDRLTDEYGFPFEPEGCYNCAPLEFKEVAEALQILLSNMNYAAVRFNRLSPNYTLVMPYIEKFIKQMGSYCITKTVLEQSGESFPNLKIFSVKDLHSMVSVHFRKCCMAYNDLRIVNQGQDLNIMGWIFRWALLSDRLKATQNKINKIQQGKINVETLLEKESVYKNEIRPQRDNSHRLVSPQSKTDSFPILKSFTKKVKAEKKAAEKQEKYERREAERAARRLEKSGVITPMYRPQVYRPMPFPKITGVGLNPVELRKLLMDEAKSRGDMSEAGIIAQEKIDQLIERFQNLQKEGRIIKKTDPPPVRNLRSGPSAETRKKLREKRKKNK